MPRTRRRDENRVEGTVREYGGRFQEGVGTVTGDAKTRAEGAMNEAAGAAQQLYGQTADTARQTATTLDSWFRNAIETQPYTTAAVALGIGWALGRMRRQPVIKQRIPKEIDTREGQLAEAGLVGREGVGMTSEIRPKEVGK